MYDELYVEEVNVEDVDEAQEEAVAWKGLAEMHKQCKHSREDFVLHVEWELFGEVGAFT